MNQASRIFPAPDAISCRVCGATQASQERDAFERVCGACWRKFKYQLGKRPVTVLAFDKWLGRQLFLAVNRLKRNGVLGRCEAVAARAQTYKEGYQCAMPATARVSGRLLCGNHAVSSNLVLIGDLIRSPYDTMADLMGELAQRDAKFRECLVRAIDLSALTPPVPHPVENNGGRQS